MHYEGNLNVNYTFCLKVIGMCEYNWSLGNPNKKTPKGSWFYIHAQIARRGKGA